YLVAEVNVTVSTSGVFEIEGDLYDSTGDFFITDTANQTYLEKGNRTVQLHFPGFQIWKDKKNGPYFVDLDLFWDGSHKIGEDNHTTQAYNYTDFEGSPFYFKEPSTEEGLDLDGDSLYDYLRVSVAVAVNISGVYHIEGDLWDDKVIPNYIASAKNTSYFSQGNGSVDIYFLGYDIYKAGLDGKYEAELIAFDNDTNVVDRWLHVTDSYDHDEFEHEPPMVLDPPHDDYGLDTDADTFFNYLVVNLSVDASVAGQYRFNASLHDSDHAIYITGTENVTVLATGSSVVPLYFSGWEIYNSSVDGSYNVTIRTYDVHENFLERGFYDTNEYNYTEFQHPDTTLPIISNVSASPDPQEVHGSVNVSATLEDDRGVAQCWINITDPQGMLVGNFTLNYDEDSDKWFYKDNYSKLGSYSFVIWAGDSSDNWNYSSGSFVIHDTTLPEIPDIDASPDPQEVHGDVNITAEVSDNFNISIVKVVVTDPGGFLVGNFTMEYDSDSGKYYCEQSYSVVGTYSYTIWANDTSDNWNYSSGTFVMHDTTLPTISGIDASPNPQEVHHDVNITANVDDNYLVSVVKVVVTDPDGV
ncbi:MAG: hypothetical protein KAW09_12300, partial [Thermoplasmata archaeon]|nr:hypothetical protein [Thermoplasmata archaeon]